MGKYRKVPLADTLRDGLRGSDKQITWALKIREDFLLEAAGKGRLWEVQHYLPDYAPWWIENRNKLWELYNGELQLIIRRAQEEKRLAKRGKTETVANENDAKTITKTRAARRTKQVAIQSHGRIRSFAS